MVRSAISLRDSELAAQQLRQQRVTQLREGAGLFGISRNPVVDRFELVGYLFCAEGGGNWISILRWSWRLT